MRRLVLSVSVIASALIACGLSVTGLAPFDVTAPDGGSSTSSSSSSSSASSSSSSSSGAPIDDASDDAPNQDLLAVDGCLAPTFTSPGVAFHQSSLQIVLDGQTGEWPCSAFQRLDRKHAQLQSGAVVSFVDYAVAWGDNGMYFAARVTDTSPPRGDDPVSPYNDDGIELYLGDAPAAGKFGPHDLHVIVDWKNNARVYAGGDRGGVDASATVIQTFTTSSGNGFSAEIFVPNAFLGSAPGPGTKIFEVMLNDQLDPSGVRAYIGNYASDPGSDLGGCDQGDQENECNTKLWGTISLEN